MSEQSPTASAARAPPEFRLRSFAVRFALIATALAIPTLPLTSPLAQWLLPWFRVEIEALDDSYRIDALKLDRDGSDQIIRLEVGLAHDLTLNGHVSHPDPRGKAYASTLVGNVAIPLVLTTAVAMAWPARRKSAYPLRALALIPAVLVIWMLDIPIILWASLWSLHVQAFEPDRFSPLLIWSQFLHGGGRLALSASLGGVVGMIDRK